ncbi:MAG: XdhC family protein [Hyphomicrobiaceae bacterium]
MSEPIPELLALAAELSAKGIDFCLVTVVRTANATSAKAGSKAILTADGELYGFVGGSCILSAVRSSARNAIATGETKLIRVKPPEDDGKGYDSDGVELHQSSCPSGGTSDLFIEPVRRISRLVVCGASPVAAKLISLARTMGYRVVASALREDHTKLADAHDRVDGFNLTSLDLRAADAVVVATQGKRDKEALVSALATDATYVGIVGSQRKVSALKSQIANMGITQERMAALHGPAGLRISAIEPQEIALSILAEITEKKRDGVRNHPVVTAN